MESSLLFGLIEIQRDALQIFCKNGRRIMALIALFTIFAKSTLYMSSFFYIHPLMADLIIERNLHHVATSQFKDLLTHIINYVEIFSTVEYFHIVLGLATFLLSATATIIAAAIFHSSKDELSLKDLVSRTAKTWKRTLVTWLYTSFHGLCYLYLFWMSLFRMVQLIKDHTIPDDDIKLLRVFVVFNAVFAIVGLVYFSVIFSLAFVISAVEETRGTEAIRRANKISKRMKMQGILLSSLLIAVNMVVIQGINMIPKASSAGVEMIVSLSMLIAGGLLRMYWYAVFTVLYYRVVLSEDERVGGYAKTPTAIPLDDIVCT